MKVEMLSTGDEVLHGEIIDTNAVWLAATLYDAGYAMTFRTTSGDDLPTLVETLQQRSRVADILIVNGGLGPTSDDYTSQAAAQAAGVSLIRNQDWLAHLKDYFARRGSKMAAINLKQADIPETAEMLPNGNGTACGFRLELNQCQIFFTPGPPSEFQLMITEQVLPRLQRTFPLPEKLLCLRLTTFGRGESFIAAELDTLLLPPGVTLGYRAAAPVVEVKLSGNQTQRVEMEACWQQVKDRVRDYLLFEGKGNFSEVIADSLDQQHYQLRLCEGISAGLLSWTLADAQAPLKNAAILGNEDQAEQEAWLSLAEHWAKQSPQILSLAISPLIDRQYCEFHLVTPEQGYRFRVAISEQLVAMRQRLQDILVLQALYLLHRWLSGQPVSIIYTGLTVVEP